MKQQIILGILRHFLTLGGGWLVQQGYANQSGVTQIVGAVMTLIGLAWSVQHKTVYCGADDSAAAPAAPGNGGNAPGGILHLLVFALIGASLLATPSFAQSNAPTISVPAVTPALTGTANLTLGLLTNAPNAVGASAIADVAAWFIAHGAVVSGPGITGAGQYGATIGQAVTIFQTTNVNEFAWSIVHHDFYNSKSPGATDEFGTGFSYTFEAPGWLANFVIITKKPSQFTVGLTINEPTTCILGFKFTGKQTLFAPTIGWRF